jgi:hypothetical protein
MTTRGAGVMKNGNRIARTENKFPSRSAHIHSVFAVRAVASSASVDGASSDCISSRAVLTCIGCMRVYMIALLLSSKSVVGSRNLCWNERVHSTMTPVGVMRHEHVAPSAGIIDGSTIR